MKRSILSLSLAAATLSLAACGGGGGGSAPTAQAQQASPLVAVASMAADPAGEVHTLAAGDLFGTGNQAVVIGGWVPDQPGAAQLHILQQQPDGSLRDVIAQALPGGSTYGGSQHILIGDFAGNGRQDIFLPGYDAGTAPHPVQSILLVNNGDGTFTHQTLPDAVDAAGACVGDLNGDGKLDVIVSGGGSVSGSVGGIYFNAGGGSFALDKTTLAGLGVTTFDSCAVAPAGTGANAVLFGDSKALSGYESAIFVLDTSLHDLSNTGIDPLTSGGQPANQLQMINAVAADVNGDGNVDFVSVYNPMAGSGYSGAKGVLLNTGLYQYTYASEIDSLSGNLPYTQAFAAAGVPTMLFGGSDGNTVMYQQSGGQAVPFKPNFFADMASYASQPTSAEKLGGVYTSSSGALYAIANIAGKWETMPMQ